MSEAITFINVHQIQLAPLHEKFGIISEVDVCGKLIEEVNLTEEIKFELKSTTFSTITGYSMDGKILGYQPVYYSRQVKVLQPLMAEYQIYEPVYREQRLIFHCRPGFLFVVTFGPYCELIKPYTCKKFPMLISKFAVYSVGNLVPRRSTLFNLQAFNGITSRLVQFKTEDGYIVFDVDPTFDMYGVPEMLDYFIDVCKLGQEGV